MSVNQFINNINNDPYWSGVLQENQRRQEAQAQAAMEQLRSFQNDIPSMNEPIVNSLGQGNTNEAPAMSPADYVNAVKATRANAPSRLEYREGDSLLQSFAKDTGRIVTGILSPIAHPVETTEALVGYLKSTPVEQIPKDVANLLISNYNVTLSDLKQAATGKKSWSDIANQVGSGIKENPAQFSLDLLSVVLPAMQAAKGGKLVTTGTKVARGLTATKAGVARKAEELFEATDDINKVIKKSNGSLADAVQKAETGVAIEDAALKQALKSHSDKTQKFFKEYSPDTYEAGNVLATNQRAVRNGIAESYQHAEDKLRPFFDDETIFKKGDASKGVAESKERILTPEGKQKLEALANKGDETAKFVLESDDLYRKGDLFPVTHGLAEVTNKASDVDKARRILAGRASTRLYGTASYEDIAKQLTNPSDYINKQVGAIVENQIKDEIATKGTIGGESIAPKKPSDARYVSREAFEVDGVKALDNAQKAPLKPDDIAIDKTFLTEIKNQLNISRGQNPFGAGTILGDWYTLAKRNMLATGGYLAGNLQTGAANLLIDHAFNPFTAAVDIATALGSKGRLAKNAGIYRRLERSRGNVRTPILKQIEAANRPLADLLASADVKMQNLFAEVALHNRLRKKGIPVGDRAAYFEKNQENLAKIGELINDSKLTALINPTTTILPKSLHGVAGLTNPYWRWTDTAAQSTWQMFKQQPVAMNLALVHMLSNVGFDKEMQRRLGLKVSSDKPFVTYRYNPASRQVEEVTAEFLPMMNTLKLAGNAAYAISGQGDSETLNEMFSTSIPAITVMHNVFKGKNRYGRPIMRSHEGLNDILSIQGDKRYKIGSDGLPHEIVGGMGDEILATALNELFPYQRFFNRTVAPAIGAVTGRPFYAPYQQSILGSFNPRGGSFLSSGNPLSARSTNSIFDYLFGLYARPYDEQYQQRTMRGLTPKQITDVRRNMFSRNVKEQQALQRLGQ